MKPITITLLHNFVQYSVLNTVIQMNLFPYTLYYHHLMQSAVCIRNSNAYIRYSKLRKYVIWYNNLIFQIYPFATVNDAIMLTFIELDGSL